MQPSGNPPQQQQQIIHISKHHRNHQQAQGHALELSFGRRECDPGSGKPWCVPCFLGAKERLSMSAKTEYTDEPLGKVQVIPDFLPSPAELAFREEGVKVTLALSRKSVEFFKEEAARHHTQYQRMIRRLIDAYVDAQATPRD
jgi:predicted DNA binding CopG/RHH family protein